MNLDEEYKMLREEIMFNMKQVYIYFAFTVGIISSMLVYVFNNNQSNINSIFIAVFVLLICATTRVKRLMTTTLSIATYLEVFLEPNIDERNWEIRSNRQINGYTSKELDKRNPIINIMFFKTISVWFLLSIITYALYVLALFDKNKENIFNFVEYFSSDYIFIFNTIIIILLICITLSNNENNRDMYIKHWKDVKEEEMKSKTEHANR